MHQDVYLSGNRDGIGCSKRVLQQMSSEGKRLLRLDESCLSSLMILKENIIQDERDTIH